VPSTYEAGKLYNVLPSGNRAPDSTGENSGYDQTRADFDFDRGSNTAATRVNADGLIEKYRENLFTESNNFSDSDWSKSTNITLTSGQTGYDGSSDAWEYDLSTSGAFKAISQAISHSGVHTMSVYAKANTITKMSLRSLSGTDAIVIFDLSNGTMVVGANAIEGKMVDVGSGWYRCSMIYNGSSQTTNYIYLNDISTATSGSIYIQNAQLESGLVATDYLESTSVTGKAGVLIDLPRIDYSSGAGALLLEPQRANLIQYSEYFNASGVWLPNTITITDNYGTSPEGLSNSTRLVLGNLTASRIAYALTLADGTTYTFSCWYKGTAGEKLYMEGNGSGGSGTTTSKLVTLTGDWQREDLQFVGGSSSNLIYIVDSRNGAEDTAQDFEVFGAQLEAGSYVSSYIPNHGESGGVTRAADVSYTDEMFNYIGQSEGTIYAEFFLPQDLTAGENRLSLSDNTLNNWIFTSIPESGNKTRMYVRIGASTLIDTQTSTSIFNHGQNNKIAFAYKSGYSRVYVNGSSVLNSSSSFGSPTSELDVFTITGASGTGSASTQNIQNEIKQVALFKERLTNEELATLTTL